MAPELIPNLRVPYAIEVLGMRAGKSTVIHRYLQELWLRDKRYEVAFVDEGARTVKEEYGDLRYTDPFRYSMLAGTATFVGYIRALREVKTGMRLIISDRGQIDRRTFRRVLSGQGKVDPGIMEDEEEFMYGIENTPLQIGGVIMLMVRPEESMRRKEKPGPVVNMEFLLRLYEQYWRLHWEILQGEVPCCVYTCIDAEKDEEDVYGRFKYAMDTVLNIHEIFLAALATTFPREFDRARAEYSEKIRQQSYAEKVLGTMLGGNVLVVGGDEMSSKDKILDKPCVEAMWL